jgi:hypothetical protein
MTLTVLMTEGLLLNYMKNGSDIHIYLSDGNDFEWLKRDEEEKDMIGETKDISITIDKYILAIKYFFLKLLIIEYEYEIIYIIKMYLFIFFFKLILFVNLGIKIYLKRLDGDLLLLITWDLFQILVVCIIMLIISMEYHQS